MNNKKQDYVMKNKIKILLLIWPVILLIGMYWHFSYERKQIDKKLLEPDGLVWKSGTKQFVFKIYRRQDGELLHIQMKVTDPDNKEIYSASETIDKDMFGGGFVRAAQVDKDPEKEIIIWHSRARYFLDFSQGHVNKISFDRVPQQIRELAGNWYSCNIAAGLTITLLLLFAVCYYGLYFFVMILFRFFKRKKKLANPIA